LTQRRKNDGVYEIIYPEVARLKGRSHAILDAEFCIDRALRSGTVHVGQGGEKSTIQTSTGNVRFTIGR